MIWNLQLLRDGVDELYGQPFRDELSPSLQSVMDRLNFARYHYRELDQLLHSFLRDKHGHAEQVRIIFGLDQDDQEFHHFRYRAKAHIVACLQSLHALPDTLAHVIYYALALDTGPKTKIEERRISISTVRASLEFVDDSRSLLGLVNDAFSAPSFRYLSDLVNRSKHRSLIKASFTVNLNQTRNSGFKFQDFKHCGKSHESVWVDDFVGAEYPRLDRAVILIGCELNRIVLTRLHHECVG